MCCSCVCQLNPLKVVSQAPEYICVPLRKEIKALSLELIWPSVSPDLNSPLISLCLLQFTGSGSSVVCLCLPNVWLTVTIYESLTKSFCFFVKKCRKHHTGKEFGILAQSLAEFYRECNLLTPWPGSAQKSKYSDLATYIYITANISGRYLLCKTTFDVHAVFSKWLWWHTYIHTGVALSGSGTWKRDKSQD